MLTHLNSPRFYPPQTGDGLTNRRMKGDIQAQPRGFYTGPAKRGGYGYNKTTLSERQGFRGVATEYEYQHDPEELQKERRRVEREADVAARQPQPFRPSNPPKRGGAGVPNITISKGKGVAGEYEYILAANVKDTNVPPGGAAAAGKRGGGGGRGRWGSAVRCGRGVGMGGGGKTCWAEEGEEGRAGALAGGNRTKGGGGLGWEGMRGM